jgi:hypothetical protein
MNSRAAILNSIESRAALERVALRACDYGRGQRFVRVVPSRVA